MSVSKALLTIIYPIWFVLAKTKIGFVLMICIIFAVPLTFINSVSPNTLNSTGPQAEGMGIGLAVFAIGCCLLVANLFARIGYYLEDKYKALNYKTKKP